jgi:hypothetical protein
VKFGRIAGVDKISFSKLSRVTWNLRSVLKSCAISLTSLWNGNLRMRSSVDF